MRRMLRAAGVLAAIAAAVVAATAASGRGATAAVPANVDVSQRHLNESEEAIAVNPTNPRNIVVVTNVGWTLAYARRPDEAISAYRRALALDPSYIQARWRLGNELAFVGRFDDAITEARRVVELTRRSPSSVAWLAQAYARAGRRTDAIGLLKELLDLSRTRYVSPVGIYGAYFFLGDADQGFAWLEKSFQERSNGVAYLAVDAVFDRVRDDPRYRQIATRIGLTYAP